MIESKQLIFGAASREQVLEGVRKLTQMVVATMGPKGRNILIERQGRKPYATKDGVTVAREIDLPDPFENMGAQLVKEAAEKTNDAAGDGTTTATLLAYSIMKEGMQHVQAGRNAISVKRGIDRAVGLVTQFLDSIKKEIDNRDEYKAIATISAQDERVGDMIAEILEDVGPTGVVTVEKGSGFGLEKEHVEGMQFDAGYASPYFVTHPDRMECVLENVPIILTDERVVTVAQILPILDKLGKSKRNTVVILADYVEGDALAMLVINKINNNFCAVPVRSPAFGSRRSDFLADIAALTGGTVLSSETGKKLENADLDDLGKAKKVVISKYQTMILGGAGTPEAIETRVNELKLQIKATEKDSDRSRLEERLAKLSGGVGIIKVGAATEFEQKELQHRVEDALSATKAAVEEGIVPGGGVAYLRAVQELEVPTLKSFGDEDERLGAEIIFDALGSCFNTIVGNAGFDAEIVRKKVLGGKGAFGFNAASGEYGDLIDMRVINPKKVERCALENAASVAGMFLTLEGAIADTPMANEET
jgi:chaperonin GroEL